MGGQNNRDVAMARITKTGLAGIMLIKAFEGFRSYPYLCRAGVPTIGYGSTYYPDGKRVTLDDSPITEKQAQDLLMTVITFYEKGVDSITTDLINQNQFDALVSFSFNCGVEALRTSTLLRKINTNIFDKSIPSEFKRWNKSGGKVTSGLVRRRAAEAELYITPFTSVA